MGAQLMEAAGRKDRASVRQLLVLAGLTGFAISQPLLSVLGNNPTTVALHGVEQWKLVAFAFVVAFVPPLVLWAAVRGVALLSRAAADAAMLVIAAGLVALTTIQVAKSSGVEAPWLLLLVSGAAGVAFAVVYARVEIVATWAAYTAVLPVLAVASFLLLSPTADLLTPASKANPAAADAGHPSVVVLVLDELPTRSLLDDEDQIDRARFPHLAALADDATWYRHHTSVASQTAAAVPSLLSGMLPTEDPPLAADHPDNLFTLLAPTHELEVLESATQLCPYERCAPSSAAGEAGTRGLLDLTAELWVDRIEPRAAPPTQLDDFAEAVRPADETTPATSSDGTRDLNAGLRATPTRADELIDAFDVDRGPALYYLHLQLPHEPWHYYPDGELYDESDPIGLSLAKADRPRPFSWSPWVSAVYEQRHLLQLQYADRLVGRILDGLDAAGLYDDSLVVVASDHGVSFEPGSRPRAVSASTIDAIAYAPLLIKAPGQRRGTVDDSNLMSIDLVPTIAAELGIPLTWDPDGAAAGTPAIAARGTTKQIGSFQGLSQLRLEKTFEFDDASRFPDVGKRFIGALTRPEDPLSGLVDRIGLAPVVGRRLDDLDPAPGRGVLRIPRLDDLRHPVGPPYLGVVAGRVRDAPPSARVVLAVDGTVVAASELSVDAAGEDGRVMFLLPQGLLSAENEIRAALIDGDQIIELRVE